MFECLSMLCVMIAAKQQNISFIDPQNQQKSTKNQLTINHQQSIPDNNDQNRRQEADKQQPIVEEEEQHETRSEKRITTRAVSNMQKSNIFDELPPLVGAGGGNNHKKPANSPNGASLTTTSALIQQKQQKFLAAAAKSATSPPSAMIKTPSTTSINGASINNIKRLPYHSSEKAQTVVDIAVTDQKPFIMSDDIIVNCCQPVVVFDANVKPLTCVSSVQAVDMSQLPHAGRSLAISPATTSPSCSAAVATMPGTILHDQQLESKRSVVRISAETDFQLKLSPALLVKSCNANLESAQKSARYDQTNQVTEDLSTDAASTADKRRASRKVIGEEDERAEEVEKIDLDDKGNSSFVVSFASDQSGRNVSTSSTSPTSLQNYHHHLDNNFLSSKQHFINNNNNKHQNITQDNHHHHNHHRQNYHNQHKHYQNNHNNITTTTTTPLSHPDHQYHHNQSINYNNCTNNIMKMPTQKFKHNQENFIKPKDQKISLVNKDNITCSTPHSIGTKSSITSNIHQDNIIVNTGAGQQPSIPRQQFNNFNNTINHHHHHHQQQPQQTMAHYKFHNDCQSSVLTYEQVKRLDFVMDQTVPIHGRGNFPTLYVKLKELIRLVKYKLQTEHSIQIRDVRLNGGAASYVLAPENSHYNDLDLIFGIDLSNEDQFDVIRDVVLECLEEFFPNEHQDNQYNGMIADHVNINETGTSTVVDGSLTATSDKLIEESPSKGQVGETISCDSKDLTATNGYNERSGVIVDVNGLASVAEERQDAGLEIEGSIGDESINSSDDGSGVYQQTRQIADHPACAMQQNFQYYQMPLSSGAIKEAYVHKMVKVNDDDRWSLISLGVQQSEVNCCGLNSCSLINSQRNSQQQINCTGCARQQHKFPSVVNQSVNSQLVSKENSMRDHQFPNSIELKFVDRMRRKFEFSVDSFQIILDSLIQFYDCAPQSTISSQRSLINSQLAATMINTRTSVDNKRCSGCCGPSAVVPNCKFGDNSGNLSKAEAQRERYSHTQNNQHMSAFTGTKSCTSLMNSTRSYYQLPIESANSPSISSAASSSGCSSSSSVVSSSSSSLSCDEDHEDLYCDTDSPSSSSSSSTSTSSLISSTTLSLLSPDGLNNSDRSNLQKYNRSETLQQTQGGQCGDKDDHHNASRRESTGKQNANVVASSKDVSGYCMSCCCQKNLASYTHECEADIRTSCAVISENFYPTVIGRSEYGNFKEALYHLEKKLIATRSPEEIRGGGMLKYCNLLVKSYKPVNVYQIRTLERYMCSRFFIDFSDLNQQQAKLESYLANHFSDDPMLKFDYLTILHNVVQRSTVCLMNHELRLTLDMIRNLAYKLNEQRQQQQQHHQQLHQQPTTNQNPSMAVQPHQQVQQQNLTQAQHQQYYKQKPVLIQSGVYRVKLVNYTLARPKT